MHRAAPRVLRAGARACSPPHCSTVGMRARSKARSVSIMHSSIIPRLCNSPFKKPPSGVSLELTNLHSSVDWLLHAGTFTPSCSPPNVLPSYSHPKKKKKIVNPRTFASNPAFCLFSPPRQNSLTNIYAKATLQLLPGS